METRPVTTIRIFLASSNELKKDRDAMIARADARGVHENLKLMNAEQVPMHRD